MALSKILEALNLSKGKTATVEHRPVAITRGLNQIIIQHDGKPFEIMRAKDNDAVLPPMFAKTSRPCPPFCVQPMTIAEGVETIGELEFLDYLVQKSEGDDSLTIVDSRTADWAVASTIPGTINVPWISLSREVGVTAQKMIDTLTLKFGVLVENETVINEYFEADKVKDILDFSDAKTLVLFCNGTWCEQTTINVRSLIHLGYPVEKIKYYRNGMQGWVGLGFPTVP
ncbi:MAG: rhodanese-like domain-containing protein [Cocleimonas sp.]|nr:rhodanese-like domain-containing protein [Cocleimonas sp.]